MVAPAPLSVRPAREQDRREISNLLDFEPYVHRHLDWRPALDWLGHDPYLVAESAGQVSAALACPPDPPGVAWIRVFACTSAIQPGNAWKALWPAALNNFSDLAEVRVAALPLHNWFRSILEQSGFSRVQTVVMLAWEGEQVPPAQTEAVIRPMTPEDITEVHAVDSAAFDPLWRNSQATLRLALRQAAQATVALLEGEIAGYQISTPSPHGIHLARLAVPPSAQGRGVGYALVKNLLDGYRALGHFRVSVNTQADNYSSLALYHKAGFRPTGEQFPVFQRQL